MIQVNAKDFGLVSGTTELQYAAIQAAIDHCFLAGGREVRISKGEYRMGDIRIRSNVTLRVEGDLASLVKVWSDGNISLQNVESCATQAVCTSEEPFFSKSI